jgi:hypothetical protein
MSGRSPRSALLIAVLGALVTGPVDTGAAEAAAPGTFITLRFDGPCDAQNNRLWLVSSHTFKTIAVTVRWRAAGGKDLVEQFFQAPNSSKELGCAASAEVVDATFADF